MTSRQIDRPEPHEGIRRSFVLVLLTCVALLLFAGWVLKLRPVAPRTSDSGGQLGRAEASDEDAQAVRNPASAAPRSTLAERMGIEVSAVRLTLAGRAVDVRYKVLDPDRAARLADRNTKAFLIDQATGRRLALPGPPRRPSAGKPAEGSSYFMMFASTGAPLKPGAKLALFIGDAREDDLVLQ